MSHAEMLSSQLSLAALPSQFAGQFSAPLPFLQSLQGCLPASTLHWWASPCWRALSRPPVSTPCTETDHATWLRSSQKCVWMMPRRELTSSFSLSLCLVRMLRVCSGRERVQWQRV